VAIAPGFRQIARATRTPNKLLFQYAFSLSKILALVGS
jgi:hypothetical protein